MLQNNLVLAIGNFDGVHLGHQKVILQARELAKKNNLQYNWGVMFFTPHPRVILKNHNKFLLTTDKQKEIFLNTLHVDNIIKIPFKNIRNLSPKEFFCDVLVNQFKVKGLVTGEDFRFGKHQSGSILDIKQLSNDHGIEYVCVKNERYNDDYIYSSTNIRKLINEGNVELANNLIGRNFSIVSTVIHGRKLGRKLGYPTANLNVDNYVSLKYGIYIVNVFFDNKKYQAIASFGLRPTIQLNDNKEVLEVHLFNYEGDLYDKEIQVDFLSFVREERRYDSLNELKEQIDKDMLFALDYFKII